VTLKKHIHAIVQASLDTGHFPTCFKNTLTVVMKKPLKPDYTLAKAYRPIALENTLGKVIESVVAETLSYLVEEHKLQPPNHFGAHPGRSTEDVLVILTENIHWAWKQRDIYTAIFMDVAGAFNNVHHERLIHNCKNWDHGLRG